MSWAGEPGPYLEPTEQEQVHRLLVDIGHTLDTAYSFPAPDGENHKILVDAYLLGSTKVALEHYETLLNNMPGRSLITTIRDLLMNAAIAVDRTAICGKTTLVCDPLVLQWKEMSKDGVEEN